MAKRRILLAALAAVLAGAAPRPATADERILDYHSDIAVAEDGWLTVVETIRVRCERREIKRGIYRDFPVRYKGRRDFRAVIVPFEVVGVERDGKPEPYHVTSKGDSKRLYVGSKNRLLKRGVYEYRLSYRTCRQLGFFEEHDELYWNVTGNDWKFPIDSASAAVTLPAGVRPEEIGHEAYTGPAGAKGADYTSSVGADGRVHFRTTRPLGRGEGLTIVATFPKGLVTPPTAAEEMAYFLRDNAVVLAALVGLLVVAAYYAVAWLRVGRDPAKGVIIPLYEPPEGLCPAAVRYVLRMAFDRTCFAAAVINMAVKKYLCIEDDDGDYVLSRQEGAEEAGLSRAEAKAGSRLFRSGSSIELDNANHSRFRKAMDALKKVLAEDYKGTYFFSNVKWFVPGVLLSVATLAAVALVSAFLERRPEVAFLCVWLTGWSFGVFFLVRQVIRAWQGVRGAKGAGGKAASTGGAVFLTLFSVPFVAAEIGVTGALAYMTSIWLLPILVLLGLLNVRFYHLLKRPTPEGRKVMDRIEGLRMYLGTAEQELLDAAHPPARTPELFERFLPYALALDVENAWAEKFEDVLERAALEREGYRPGWYRGRAWEAMGASAFASSLGSSFSSALSSASTAPGSTSGSGGGGSSGGSSGGGGGGGGGGGW